MFSRVGAYLKTAFTTRWNLLLFGGGVAAALISGFPGIVLPLVLAGEVYYLASMLANDRFRSAVEAQDAKSRRAVEAAGAREAYERIRKNLPPALLKKYFLPLQGKWSVAQECRRLVEFRSLNLNGAWPMLPACDIVFLRNVMLYFDVPTRAALVQRVRRVLHPEGGLFLGGAETMIGIDAGYERIAAAGCSYYRPKRRG